MMPFTRLITMLMFGVLCFVLIVPIALQRHNTADRRRHPRRLCDLSPREYRAMATDEAALLARTRRAERLRGIYVIVNEDARVLEIGCAALEAGVKVLQYRAKDGVNVGHLQLLRQQTLAHGAL